MLNVGSFNLYSNLITSEVLGFGSYVYECLIETFNGSVVKVMIGASSIKECLGYLCRRFMLSSADYKSVGDKCYSIFDTMTYDYRPAFKSMICRKIS